MRMYMHMHMHMHMHMDMHMYMWSKINMPATNLVAHRLPATKFVGAAIMVAGKGAR